MGINDGRDAHENHASHVHGKDHGASDDPDDGDRGSDDPRSRNR